jgi:hypothetical protein
MFHFYPIRRSTSLFYGVFTNIDLEFFALNLHNPFKLHKRSFAFTGGDFLLSCGRTPARDKFRISLLPGNKKNAPFSRTQRLCLVLLVL